MGYIYKITNNVNGKVYIGQTFRNVAQRFSEHIRMSRKEVIGYESLLYRAIKKYGEKAFSVETIEKCDDEKLNEREIFWIEHFRSCGQGYNISLGVQKNPNYRVRDICQLWDAGYSVAQISEIINLSKQNVSKRLRENGVTKWEICSRANLISSGCRLKVIRFSKDGKDIKVYNSITDAAFENDTTVGAICNVCKGRRNYAKGYRWAYYENEDSLKNIKPTKKEEHCIKQVHKYSLDGEYICSFESLSHAARSMGRDSVRTISVACKNPNCTGYGFRWSYEKQNKLQAS